MEPSQDQSVAAAHPAKPRLRWYQFHLRTLLVFVFLVAVFFSWVAVERAKNETQNAAMRRLLTFGSCYALQRGKKDDETFWAMAWRRLLAEEDYSHVEWFHFNVDFRSDLPERQIQDNDLKLLTQFPQTKRVGLSGCKRITDAGLKHLGDLPKLQDLELDRTNISGAGLKYLIGSRELQFLRLENAKLSPEGVKYLGELNLKSLWLRAAKLPDPDCECLNFPSLRDLVLDEAKISQATLLKFHLSNNAEDLRFSNTEFFDDCIGIIPSGVSNLSLSNTRVTDKAFEKARLDKLESLDLSDTAITDATLAHFRQRSSNAEPPIDGPLLIGPSSSLLLANTKITDAGLADLEVMEGLEGLDLSGTAITDAGLGCLEKARGLVFLVVARTAITDEGIRHLENLDKLGTLDISSTKVTDASLMIIGKLRKVCSLDLSDTEVTDAGFVHLQLLSKLFELRLSRTKITDAGLANFPNLQRLELAGTAVTDDGLRRLGETAELSRLDLSDTKITDAGLLYFRQCPRLCILTLANTQITDSGFANLKNPSDFLFVDLSGTKITDDTLDLLKGSACLFKLNVERTSVTEKGVKRLQKALPYCNIEWNSSDSVKKDCD